MLTIFMAAYVVAVVVLIFIDTFMIAPNNVRKF